MFLHSGKPVQARKRPKRPQRMTIGRPHLSQTLAGLLFDARGAFGAGKRRLQRLVEVVNDRLPLALAFGDLVQLTFHLRGEADTRDPREVAGKKIIDDKSKVLRLQGPAVRFDVAAVLDRR